MSQWTRQPNDDPRPEEAPDRVNSEPSNKPRVPDHELLRIIGAGSYGEIWLARSATCAYRAVKVVYRGRFEDHRPFEREFRGIQKFEPVSRTHASQVAVLHVGRKEDYFYYIMELADDAGGDRRTEVGGRRAENGSQKSADGQSAGIGSNQLSVISNLSEVKGPSSASEPPSSVSISNLKSQISNPDPPKWATYSPRTLKSDLQKCGRLSGDACLRVALSLTTALEHLHQNGLVHRDIKPSNIIFVGGVPKLADIGLVAAIDGTLSFVGTEGFVPPEGPGSPQADIYSLGKVLYEMCTGRDRQEFPELPTGLRENPDREVLVEFNEIVLRACEHDPRKRYRSAEEMHADLALLQAGKSIRKARGIEKQLRLLSQFGIAAAAAVAVIAGAWVFQQRQTREARYWAEQSRQRLVRIHSAQGIQKLEEGDFLASLPWLVEALKLDHGFSTEETHRLRLGMAIRQSAAITAFWHAPQAVDSIEVSPDQKSVMTVQDRAVQVWDLKTGHPRTPSLPHAGKVRSAVFSPQSDRIFTAAEGGELIVWNLSTGRQRCTLDSTGVEVKLADFSPDGMRLATAGHREGAAKDCVQLWDADSGNTVTPVMEYDGAIRHLLFSPDGSYLATHSHQPFGSQIRIWDTRSGRALRGPLQYGGFVSTLQFSPDSRFLCIGQNAVLDLASGQSRQLLPMDSGVDLLCFSSDGKWLAVGNVAGTASVYEFTTGKLVGPSVSHKRPIRSISLSPDSQYLLTASDDGTARIWHIASGLLAGPPLPHESKLRGAAFCLDGRGVVTIADRSVRLWNLSLTPPVLHSFVHQEPLTAAGFSPDGRRIVTATLRTSQTLDAIAWRMLGPPLAHENTITALAFSPDSQLAATGSADRTVRIWNLATGRMAGVPLPHNEAPGHVLFHRHKPAILSTSGSSLLFWDLTESRQLGPALELSNRVVALAWRPEKDACTVACQTKDGFSEMVTVGTNPGLKIIGSKLWPEKIIRLLAGTQKLLVASTPDDLTVRVWDSDTGLPVSPALKHEQPVRHFASCASQTKAAITCADGSLHLWDLRSGEWVASPFRLRYLEGIEFAEFSPDERQLLTASGEGRVRIWDLAPEQRPLAEIESITSMLAAREIDSTGTVIPLSPSRLAEIWRKLNSASPFPEPSASLSAAWHQREADDCQAMRQRRERLEDSRAALFHRNLVVSLRPTTAQDLLLRAIAHAHLDRWDKAKVDYDQALSLGAQADCTVPDQLLLQVMTGDMAGYQGSCRQLMARFATTENPEQANDAVWLSSLLPNGLPNYELPVRMMREAARQRPTQNNIFNTFGAALLRAGEFEAAVRTLQEGIGFFPGEGSAFDLIYLAMAHSALGHTKEARAFLEKAVRLIDTPESDQKWKWRVELGLLRKEAEERVHPKL